MAEANTAEVEAKVDAAFLGAGFGDTPPAPAAKVVEEPVVEPAKPEAAAVPVIVPDKPQYVRLTKQEWDNTKAAAGKVSSLESQVAKLVGAMPRAEQIVQQAIEAIRAQTPSGAKVTVTPEDFAELGENFEEVSGMTMKGLQRVLDRFNVTGVAATSVPAPPVDMDAAFDKWQIGRESNALAKAYPDWSDIVGRPPAEGAPIAEGNPFRAWLAAQPAEYQQEVGETLSPAVVQAAIDRFRAAQTKAPASPSPKPDKAAARRAVIEDAVTPRADGNPPPLNQPQSADDAFSAGFKAVKKN